MSPADTDAIDPEELARFDQLAADWWDPAGPLRTLHAINPVRLAFIDQAMPLRGRQVLDIGCGGGLLSEAMAGMGASVTGVDPGAGSISAARTHDPAGTVTYHQATAAELLPGHAHTYDIITCMEMLEHVPDPAALVQTMAELLRPGGRLFLSTINRNARSYVAAIIGAEYLLGLLPRGTHDYARFIRPSELCAWLRAAGFEVVRIRGMHYLPGVNRACLTDATSVNYLVHARLRN